ncbi:MAG: cobalamin-dependent protein [Proteobacteria bacterium]|nr:cobalamin-dependent protein [Pseudomonadota bacterium]
MQRARILIAKIGLDGHDRGSRIVATYLRDAGMEVVYTGPWQRIEQVVRASIDEDIDVIGISTLANDYVLIPELLEALAAAGAADIPVIVGGIVPLEDERRLLELGVRQVFHPGATRQTIVDAVQRLAAQAAAARPLRGELTA